MVPVPDAHLFKRNIVNSYEAPARNVMFKEQMGVQLIVVSTAAFEPFHDVDSFPQNNGNRAGLLPHFFLICIGCSGR